VALPDLAPVLAALNEWARAHSVPVHEGILELSDALPQVTVVGFDPEDVDLFLTLATALERPVLVLNQMILTPESLLLVEEIAASHKPASDRRYYAGVIAAARSHLGELEGLTAYAFAPDLARVVVFRASTDWGAPLFDLSAGLDGE